MRQLDILSILPSTTPGAPSSFTVAGDVTDIFHGRELISTDPITGAQVRSPVYTVPVPAGAEVLVATTFRVTGNSKYNGSYTVFTRTAPSAPVPAEFIGGNTIIRVFETLPEGSGPELVGGQITLISTYKIDLFDESLVVLEKQTIDRSVDLTGKLSTGWGELLANNIAGLVSNFAGPTPPEKPFLGQSWYDVGSTSPGGERPSALHVCTDTDAAGGFANPTWTSVHSRYEHEQPIASNVWQFRHGFGRQFVHVQVIVDTPDGPTIMLPARVVFVDADNIRIEFTGAESGRALLHW